VQVQRESSGLLQQLTPYEDCCSVSLIALLPATPGVPAHIAVTVSRPRLIVLRRFVNNVLYASSLVSKELEAFQSAVEAYHRQQHQQQVQTPFMEPAQRSAEGRSAAPAAPPPAASTGAPFAATNAAAGAMAAAAAAAAATVGTAAAAAQQVRGAAQAPQQAAAPAIILLELRQLQLILPASHACKTLDNEYLRAQQMVAEARAAAAAAAAAEAGHHTPRTAPHRHTRCVT
jgi:hypothetical protein